VIAPWQVYELPEEWLQGAQAITTRVGQAQKANAVIEQRLAAWRANHPAYQKHS
jgi:hypothetical protein